MDHGLQGGRLGGGVGRQEKKPAGGWRKPKRRDVSSERTPVLGYLPPPTRLQRRWGAWLISHALASYAGIIAGTIWWYATTPAMERDEPSGLIVLVVVASPLVLPLYTLLWLFVSISRSELPPADLAIILGVYAVTLAAVVLVHRKTERGARLR